MNNANSTEALSEKDREKLEKMLKSIRGKCPDIAMILERWRTDGWDDRRFMQAVQAVRDRMSVSIDGIDTVHNLLPQLIILVFALFPASIVLDRIVDDLRAVELSMQLIDIYLVTYLGLMWINLYKICNLETATKFEKNLEVLRERIDIPSLQKALKWFFWRHEESKSRLLRVIYGVLKKKSNVSS